MHLKMIIYIIITFFLMCCAKKSETGYYFAPDMYEPRHIISYAGIDTLSSKTQKYPINYEPYLLKKTNEHRLLAGKLYSNPNTNKDSISMELGKKLYTNHCALCHGDLGDGKGYLFTSEKYNYPPANLLNDKIVKMPDYEIYHVISVGFNLMKGLPNQISSDDKWLIVDYTRKLNN